MALPLIGAVIGLVGSAIPEVIKFFKNRGDQKHELELFRLQSERMKLQHTLKIQEIDLTAEIKETEKLYEHAQPKLSGWKILDGLIQFYNASVRPTITYAFTGLYAFIKYAQLQSAMTNDVDILEAAPVIWTEIDAAIWTTIITFWFGSRNFKRVMNYMKG